MSGGARGLAQAAIGPPSIAPAQPQSHSANPASRRPVGEKTEVDHKPQNLAQGIGLAGAQVAEANERFAQASATWPDRITNSFLSTAMKGRYLALLGERRERLGIN